MLRLLTRHNLRPKFYAKRKASLSYINLVSFIKIPFQRFFLQTFKTPEAIILGFFLVVFHGLPHQILPNLFKFITSDAVQGKEPYIKYVVGVERRVFVGGHEIF